MFGVVVRLRLAGVTDASLFLLTLFSDFDVAFGQLRRDREPCQAVWTYVLAPSRCGSDFLRFFIFSIFTLSRRNGWCRAGFHAGFFLGVERGGNAFCHSKSGHGNMSSEEGRWKTHGMNV